YFLGRMRVVAIEPHDHVVLRRGDTFSQRSSQSWIRCPPKHADLCVDLRFLCNFPGEVGRIVVDHYKLYVSHPGFSRGGHTVSHETRNISGLVPRRHDDGNADWALQSGSHRGISFIRTTLAPRCSTSRNPRRE